MSEILFSEMNSVWNSVWILCAEMNSVCNFVRWNEFSLKLCVLKRVQLGNSDCNFVPWSEFSLKFCTLKWIQSEIQSEIVCSEVNSVWNFVLWNKFRLKFSLKFVLRSEFSLKFCALKRIQSEILRFEIICSELKFFVLLGHRIFETLYAMGGSVFFTKTDWNLI